MSAPATLDLEALLAPISEDLPQGQDPRDDDSPQSLYYRAKGARSAARSAERAATDEEGSLPEDWYEVVDAATALLTTRAKDLEVAAWLAEAKTRIDGFAGLRDSLKLLTGLVDNYWEGVYPLPDEDGLETRLAAIGGLNGSGGPGTLNQPLQTAVLFGSDKTFSLWHYNQTTELATITDKDRLKARAAAGVRTPEEMREAMTVTTPSALRGTLATIEEGLSALAALGETLDRHAGADSPSLSALRNILQNAAGAIRHFGGDKAVTPASDLAAEGDAAQGEGAGEAVEGQGGGGSGRPRTSGFQNREEALAAIEAIATYFRRTEPQAMISYTLDDAVRRARMTLPELLMELTEDSSQIRTMLTAAGIKSRDEGE